MKSKFPKSQMMPLLAKSRVEDKNHTWTRCGVIGPDGPLFQVRLYIYAYNSQWSTLSKWDLQFKITWEYPLVDWIRVEHKLS